jgi:alkanesulfonate monooxygenase SsuD/methylene tetrahydromethanopterin reductase-like flavin-dependent oxidoreductase (luciferase family)
MRIGAVYPQTELGGDPEAVRRIGIGVEQLGFDHLLAYDHVLGAVQTDRDPPLAGPYDETVPFHDPLVMFGYLAALTERIELVTGILVLPAWASASAGTGSSTKRSARTSTPAGSARRSRSS